MNGRGTWLRPFVWAAGLSLGLVPTAVHAEPDDLGPFAVAVDAYDFGDEAFAPVNLTASVELRAAVYSPEDLSEGPFPIVLLLHGRHATCYDPQNPMGSPNDGSILGGTSEWPCQPGREPIPSHEGYGYLGELLASHGMVVVSISANGISSFDNESTDSGASARADLLNEHLLLWASWSAGEPGPFEGRFEGAIDLEHVGAMGHSRGGEGVATFAAADVAGGLPNILDAALLVAPTDFNRTAFGTIPLGVVLPYCDGDVFTLEGVHFYDDARDLVPDDPAEKLSLTFSGANHNFFNTIWTPGTFVAAAVDDFDLLVEFFGPDPACSGGSADRISATQQQDAFNAYAGAFFRWHLAGDETFRPVLQGDAVPASAEPARPQISYLDPAQHRLVINALETEASLSTNALDGAVETDATAAVFCGLATDPMNANTFMHCVEEPGFFNNDYFDARQPHTPGLGQLRLTLEDGQRWSNALPPATSAEPFAAVQVRVGIDFETSPPAGTRGELLLVLEDARGTTASASLPMYGDALREPLGALENIMPRKMLHSARVPLEVFEGVDLADLVSVTLEASGGSIGVLVSDLAFVGEAPVVPDPGTSTGPGPDPTTDGSDSTTGIEGGTSGDLSTGPAPGDGTGSSGAPEASGDAADGCGCQQQSPPMTGFAALFFLLFVRRRVRL